MRRALPSLLVVASLVVVVVVGSGCETLQAAFAPKSANAAKPVEPSSPAPSKATKKASAPKKKRVGKKGAPAPAAPADEHDAPVEETPPVVAAPPPAAPPPEAPPATATVPEGHVSALTRKAVLAGAGELTREEVKEVVNLGLAGIDRCYDEGLVRQAALSGKVTLAFAIDDAGNVASARARTSTLPDDRVVACVVDQVRSWRFPAPRGGAPVDVELPLVFETR